VSSFFTCHRFKRKVSESSSGTAFCVSDIAWSDSKCYIIIQGAFRTEAWKRSGGSL